MKKLKDKWRELNKILYWRRGMNIGIILGIIMIIVLLFAQFYPDFFNTPSIYNILTILSSPLLGALSLVFGACGTILGMACIVFLVILIPLVVILSLFFYGMIGGVIGLIIGKLKSRKKLGRMK